MIINFIFLLIILVALSLYLPLNKRPSKYYWQTPLDGFIPLIPSTVFIYLSYHLYSLIGYVYLIFYTSSSLNFFISVLLSTFIGYFIWYFFPNGTRRPTLQHDSSLSTRLLQIIYQHDGDTNACPSAHVYHTLVISWYLIGAIPSLTPLILLVCSLITLSTLTTKQHYVVDIPAAIIVAFISIYFSEWITTLFFFFP